VSKNLVIVESPAKAKTIKKYLGKEFEVLASFGHIRDLLPKEGAVDTEHGFTMNYQLIEKNVKHVDAICKAMQHADALYLATDPDREGEAISWHLYEILKDKRLLHQQPVYRVVFHEITQQAIQEAVAHPRQLSMDLVNAQQARRALDYLVGFNLSPLLWKKIRYGLSAGRVQSPALRLIVEREEAIEKFKPCEYWTVEADCQKEKQTFIAKLTVLEGKKLKPCEIDIKDAAGEINISNATQAAAIRTTLLTFAKGQLQVVKVEKKQRKRQPSAPFTTSTLQQEAARKLGFTSKHTMQIAQQLYEGIDAGSGAVGLITYMRTDSVNLAAEAVAELRDVITTTYGTHNVPHEPRQYKTKAKNAQEAHEAIRPTSAKRLSESLKNYLTKDQLELYTLIWKRTIACQMVDAKLDTVAIDLTCHHDYNFRATGSTVVEPGFMIVYQEGIDDQKLMDEDEKILPILQPGEWVQLKNNDIRTEQHFTEPPPRFSEATLVKHLEEYGIGRPSTYATIISTLQQREYVVLEKKRFIPTDVGRVVNKFLTAHFTQYVDYDFTAKLEDQLDAVSRGEQEWIPLMDRFWKKFKKLVDEKAQTVQRKEVTQEALDESCPKCGSALSIRLGKRGRFIGCSAYPNCDYTRGLDDDPNKVGENGAASNQPVVVEGRCCPSCQAPLHLKQGSYGKFIGCSNYPKCKYIESLDKPADSGIRCPSCGKGTLLKKKSRYGTFFYSCSTYPTCKYAIANEPLAEPCPKCGWPILMLKTTKRRGTEKVCPQKDVCDYAEPFVGETKTDST
jgi:DNA topoisomerase-1